MQVSYNRAPAYMERHILHLPATLVNSGGAGETTTSFEYDKVALVDQGVIWWMRSPWSTTVGESGGGSWRNG